MEEYSGTENSDNSWRMFLKRHWNMLIYWIIAGIVAAVGSVLVYIWFVGDAQSTGMVPTVLSQWSLGHMVTFMLHLAFWELLMIGIPVAAAAIIGWLWWKKIPEPERKDYQFWKSSRKESGGGGISFLFFVAFCLKIYVDGNWDVAVASWTLDYVVNSMITILVWTAIIFGIPAIIIGLIWLSRQTKKSQ